jgi:hypothetical protein
MGIYLNPGNENFAYFSKNEIYVDKSGIIPVLIDVFEHWNKYVCVSRPRRFGKTVIGNMLTAYFSKGCDSKELFANSIGSKNPIFEKYLNKVNVIKIDLNSEYQNENDTENLINIISKKINEEIKDQFNLSDLNVNDSLANCILKVYSKYNEKFVIIIDEYDVLVREIASGKISQSLFDKYLSFLNGLFKSSTVQPAITLAYLTGILPIVREKIQSKLNNFTEYTMLKSKGLAPFIGFTADETWAICEQNSFDYEECKRWYDGYRLQDIELYNPRSVVEAIRNEEIGSYWGQTSTYEVISDYIGMNFTGTKDDVIKMISGEQTDVNVTSYKNTMTDFKTKDDVFTYLIHLGYLAYDSKNKQCYIPNREVQGEWINALKISADYSTTSKIIEASKQLLEDTINGDEEAVAKSLDESHIHVTSNRSYNNEDALHCAIYLSYIYALNKYNVYWEISAGKGVADMTYVPVFPDLPALIFELKHNGIAETALNQIKEKKYFDTLSNYSGNLLFVGINYDEKTKKHTCKIERFEK